MYQSTFLRYFFVLWIPFLLLPTSANATIYSDAENGNDGWFVYDNSPAGATVSVVNDAQLQSNVIQTLGDGRLNGYRLGGTSALADGHSRAICFVRACNNQSRGASTHLYREQRRWTEKSEQ